MRIPAQLLDAFKDLRTFKIKADQPVSSQLADWIVNSTPQLTHIGIAGPVLSCDQLGDLINRLRAHLEAVGHQAFTLEELRLLGESSGGLKEMEVNLENVPEKDVEWLPFFDQAHSLRFFQIDAVFAQGLLGSYESFGRLLEKNQELEELVVNGVQLWVGLRLKSTGAEFEVVDFPRASPTRISNLPSGRNLGPNRHHLQPKPKHPLPPQNRFQQRHHQLYRTLRAPRASRPFF